MVTTAPERGAVSNAFGHRNDIGNDALRFEAPKMCAGAAKASLHFIRNAHAAGGANVFVSLFQIALGKFHKAAHALDGFGNERGDFSGRGVIN